MESVQLPAIKIPVKAAMPITYGKTIAGNVQEVSSIEEVLREGSESSGEDRDDA